MKAIGRFLLSIIIGTWIIVAIFVTVCLLSYNEYRVPVFGKTTLLIIDSDELEPTVNEGDLLFVKRNSDSKINKGDVVFYYNSAMNSNTLVYHDKVEEKEEISKSETTYTLHDRKVSGEDIIGKLDGAKIYPKAGSLLGIFTSKWGFMFLVIFPTLFAIIYEIIMIFEARRSLKNSEE